MRYIVVFTDCNTWIETNIEKQDVVIIPLESISAEHYDEICDGKSKFSDFNLDSVSVSDAINKLNELDEWDGLLRKNDATILHNDGIPDGYTILVGSGYQASKDKWIGRTRVDRNEAIVDAWIHVTGAKEKG